MESEQKPRAADISAKVIAQGKALASGDLETFMKIERDALTENLSEFLGLHENEAGTSERDFSIENEYWEDFKTESVKDGPTLRVSTPPAEHTSRAVPYLAGDPFQRFLKW